MLRKRKISPETIIKEIEDYLERNTSILNMSERLSVIATTVRSWARNYKAEGLEKLVTKSHNKSYMTTFMLQAVKEYLESKESLNSIRLKYCIKSH